jgi:hypothetical protein
MKGMLPDTFSILPPVFDPVVAYGIGGLSVLAALGWVAMASRAGRGYALVAGGLLAVLMVLSAVGARTGALARFDTLPPPMAVMMGSVFALGFGMGLSRLGKAMAGAVPMVVLVGFQAFRLPLELVMHRAAAGGIMPVELSYAGYNFDVWTGAGALALVVWYLWKRDLPRTAVWIWNLWGSYCLAAIAFIAIASSPMIRFFGDTPDHVNTWVLFFPYAWLPVVLVSVAIAGHIVVWRKLRAERSAR